MKAYLIDPERQCVEQVDYDGQLGTLYDLLRARVVEAHKITSKDVVYVDEEARLTAKTDAACFLLLCRPIWLIGRGLVVSTDASGDDRDPRISLAELQNQLVFR